MTEVRIQVFLSVILTGLLIFTMVLLDNALKQEGSEIYVMFFLILLVAFLVLYFYNKSIKEKIAEQRFSKKLLSARETERKKISSDLHDDLQQDLNMIKFDFKRLAKKHFLAGPEINELSYKISDTIEKVRNISTDLYPQQLEKLGFNKSIKSLADKVAIANEINIKADISDDVDKILNDEAKINLYRVTQELFNNIVKYSEATNAQLTIFKDNMNLHMIVKDNGVGLGKTFKELKNIKMGQGIQNIKERVKLLRGRLDVQTNPGTTFKISIPIKYNIKTNGK